MVRPVSKEESDKIDMTIINPRWTICEVLRDIHRTADDIENDWLKEQIKLRTREAGVLANRMGSALRAYKGDYDEGWWKTK